MESRIQECLGFLTWNETYRGAHERWRVDHIVKALLICIKRVLSITVRDILVSAGIIFRFIIRLIIRPNSYSYTFKVHKEYWQTTNLLNFVRKNYLQN